MTTRSTGSRCCDLSGRVVYDVSLQPSGNGLCPLSLVGDSYAFLRKVGEIRSGFCTLQAATVDIAASCPYGIRSYQHSGRAEYKRNGNQADAQSCPIPPYGERLLAQVRLGAAPSSVAAEKRTAITAAAVAACRTSIPQYETHVPLTHSQFTASPRICPTHQSENYLLTFTAEITQNPQCDILQHAINFRKGARIPGRVPPSVNAMGAAVLPPFLMLSNLSSVPHTIILPVPLVTHPCAAFRTYACDRYLLPIQASDVEAHCTAACFCILPPVGNRSDRDLSRKGSLFQHSTAFATENDARLSWP
eukprot:IDg15001t1